MPMLSSFEKKKKDKEERKKRKLVIRPCPRLSGFPSLATPPNGVAMVLVLSLFHFLLLVGDADNKRKEKKKYRGRVALFTNVRGPINMGIKTGNRNQRKE